MQFHHKFSIGAHVEFNPGSLDKTVTRGTYIVKRQLPSDGADLRYSVKHASDNYERVISESQLTATS